MLFENPEDYDRIEQGDELEITDLLDRIPTRTVEVKDVTRDFTFKTRLDLTDNEVAVVLCGGQLRYLKKQLLNKQTILTKKIEKYKKIN